MKRVYSIITVLFLVLVLVGCNSENNDSSFEDKKSTHMEELEGAYVTNALGSLPELNKQELYQSPNIVKGKVKEVSESEYTEEDGVEMNYTNIVIEVIETLKGSPNEEILIRRYGGTTKLNDGTVFQYFTESPHYTEGEEVLLFLTSIDAEAPTGYNSDQYFRTVAHGKWESNNGSYVHYIEKDKEITVEEVQNNL